MRTLTLLRLILRALKEIKSLREEQATQLRTLNATLNRLLLIAAKSANYFPTALPPPDAKSPVTLGPTHYSDAITFAVAESLRSKMIEQLGREPYEEEFFAALELEMTHRARTQAM